MFHYACKSERVSLNSQMVQRLENTSSLIGVILIFRVNSVAVAADIKPMSIGCVCLQKIGALFSICGGQMGI